MDMFIWKLLMIRVQFKSVWFLQFYSEAKWQTLQALPCSFVVFVDHGCPHSFTASITKIFTDEVILSPNNTWGYLFSEWIMISWSHTGYDLKGLTWHNYYHLHDAQTFLRLAAPETIIIRRKILRVMRALRRTTRCGRVSYQRLVLQALSTLLPKAFHECCVLLGCLSGGFVWVSVTRHVAGGVMHAPPAAAALTQAHTVMRLFLREEQYNALMTTFLLECRQFVF